MVIYRKRDSKLCESVAKGARGAVNGKTARSPAEKQI